MSSWQDKPPTEQEWLDANNEGYWWIKISIKSLKDGDVIWPAIDLYEVVRITKEVLDGSGNRTNRLRFRAPFQDYKTIYCDDSPKTYKWKPVEPHGD